MAKGSIRLLVWVRVLYQVLVSLGRIDAFAILVSGLSSLDGNRLKLGPPFDLETGQLSCKPLVLRSRLILIDRFDLVQRIFFARWMISSMRAVLVIQKDCDVIFLDLGEIV